jgi:hypothetical protein
MTYAPVPGSIQCNYCSYGTYNNETMSTSCRDCEEISACYCSRR